MTRFLLPGFLMTLVLTVLTGIVYPLAVTGIAQGLFHSQADGSLVRGTDGRVIGSSLIAQGFSKPEYFHPRPSAAGSGYDATSSGGSNLGPTSAKLVHGTTKMDDKKNEVVDFDGINLRMVHYCLDNDIPYDSSVPLDQFKDAKGELDDVKLIKAFNDDKTPLRFQAKVAIPADAITTSASGLDPDISPAAAEAQIARVAHAREISQEQLRALVAAHTARPDLGFMGEPRVNVLLLNLALDQQAPVKRQAAVKR
jgi:K+-transporting ATPase ATPase C chain